MKLIKTVFVAAWLAGSAAATAAEPFKIYQVSRESIPLTVSFAGTVSADKTLQLTAQMPGRILAIAGQEGDGFEQGTVLVELDDSGLLARLEAAVAARDAAAADIRNARVQYDRELYSPRSNSAGSAPGGMGMPAMMDQMFTSPMQGFMGMRDRGQERASDLVGAETALAQANTRFKTAEANIREIQAMLRDTQGIAPFSGVIQKVHVEVGDTV
ncbi:MAG: efflux RND transporter periplasmic adaptor subunit, partial [Gammaproteobacteria bacterium]|nr:efflux RND transporter periplasmic adaptor subunit [Gammaproteobacteria bacterium]